MKKITIIANLVLLIFLLTPNTLLCQERKDHAKIPKEILVMLKSSELLTYSMGWAYNENTDEWSNYPNVICKIKGKNPKNLLNYEQRDKYTNQYNGEYYEKFTNLQTKKIKFRDSIYVLLIKFGTDIKGNVLGWVNYYKEAYIFAEKEFFKLKAIDSFVTIKPIGYAGESVSFVYEFNVDSLNKEIINELVRIHNKIATKNEYPLTTFSRLISKEGLIRFNFDALKEDFKYSYFEATKSNFNKLITL